MSDREKLAAMPDSDERQLIALATDVLNRERLCDPSMEAPEIVYLAGAYIKAMTELSALRAPSGDALLRDVLIKVAECDCAPWAELPIVHSTLESAYELGQATAILAAVTIMRAHLSPTNGTKQLLITGEGVGAQMQPSTGGAHLWAAANAVVKWPHCSVCGVIQRHDGKNRPCKGPSKIELRDDDHAIPELLDALRWFCARVDSGEIRSKKTYARFKGLIAKYQTSPQHPAPQPQGDSNAQDSQKAR